MAPNSGTETKSLHRKPVTNPEHKFGTNQDESASMTFPECEFSKNESLRPKIYTEFSTDLNGPGNSQKNSINISSNTMESKDSDVIDDKCTKNNSQKTSSNIVESKDSNVTDDKNNELNQFPRLAPNSGTETPDQPGTGTNQDENASMTFSEREFNKNMSMRPKIYTEFSTDLNGPGNSQKTSLNISSNTMKPKDSDVIDDNKCTKNNSQKTSLNISSNTMKSQDSNVIDDNKYTKNNEKSPSNEQNETPQIRKSARIRKEKKRRKKT